MLKSIMSIASFQWYSAVALLIFFTFSAGILFWIYRPNAKKTYKKISQLPLSD